MTFIRANMRSQRALLLSGWWKINFRFLQECSQWLSGPIIITYCDTWRHAESIVTPGASLLTPHQTSSLAKSIHRTILVNGSTFTVGVIELTVNILVVGLSTFKCFSTLCRSEKPSNKILSVSQSTVSLMKL